ncbi:helix-turn-helix domain-containing protein [Thauera linaloolentis]|uniref:PobR regulator n=1 Tax=Thauera linaloolentis (strain DSM 12138 / JCM 21573 / CCUG 41526 / CIP 105981 / IAM 15112 / NBRC 102519 / 47Lol) TaxID=1123367 RepID=N6Z032_THAL4|nr:helix-turn-helix domain-containing protein [Thauera linaloolentis]ENO87967.1 PobR regulator [Thauera linaloolentis 47Lol = DSM 12138]MCM8567096.1 helix-turn-helix domain-containing protein [Thauera linaloolentis]
MALAGVPTYKLFGEKELWPTPEPVHYETIAARSALYDWEITPHSHDSLMHIVFLQSGEASMTFETRSFPLRTPCLVMVPARHIHGFRFSPDIVGCILTLPQALLGELLALSPDLRPAFDTLRYLPLAIDAEDGERMRLRFEQFGREYAGRRPGRISVLIAILGVVVVELARTAAGMEGQGSQNRVRQRVERFSSLIEQHFRDWQPVSCYARRLGVSPQQLNASCRREAGLTAQDLIHERLLLEARRLLAYSDLDVTGIGYSLGFRDPAYFSRFFARKQGMAPSAFRRAHLAPASPRAVAED